MALINEHFLKLQENYFFSDIEKKINAFRVTHPEKKLLRIGRGDVSSPLPPACVEAMHRALDEMAREETFRGYGPEQGYSFLINTILKHDFAPLGIELTPSEIFVSDGAKSDTCNIGEILRWDNSMGITDPVYPVYAESNIMCGRSGTRGEDGKWSNVMYLPCTEANGFVPETPDHRLDIIYLCYPNNPTGTTLTHRQLKKWVDYALKNDTLIIYDAAYEAYIHEKSIPHSIYEIRGAKKVAIEIRSFSKTAAAMYQIQRHELHHPAGSRGGLFPRRAAADKGEDCLLHGECADYPRKPRADGPHLLRRHQRALYLGEDTGRTEFLEVLRKNALRGQCGCNAGHRLRAERGRLHSPRRLRETGRVRGGDGAHPAVALRAQAYSHCPTTIRGVRTPGLVSPHTI